MRSLFSLVCESFSREWYELPRLLHNLLGAVCQFRKRHIKKENHLLLACWVMHFFLLQIAFIMDYLNHLLFNNLSLDYLVGPSIFRLIKICLGIWNPSFNELITDTRYSMKLWFAMLFLLEKVCVGGVSLKRNWEMR